MADQKRREGRGECRGGEGEGAEARGGGEGRDGEDARGQETARLRDGQNVWVQRKGPRKTGAQENEKKSKVTR
jgi:hypothetical protein